MVISLNSIIFIQMAGFLMLLVILNIILYKPVLKVVRQRKESVEKLIDQADSLKLQAAENEKTYSLRLEEAERKAKKEYNDIVSSAAEEKEKSLHRETVEARKSIDSQKKEVFQVLNSEIDKSHKYSTDISNKIYERLIS